MGMRMPETCWAVFKWQVINLRSCCIWLVDSVESMMMHGLANPKKKVKLTLYCLLVTVDPHLSCALHCSYKNNLLYCLLVTVDPHLSCALHCSYKNNLLHSTILFDVYTQLYKWMPYILVLVMFCVSTATGTWVTCAERDSRWQEKMSENIKVLFSQNSLFVHRSVCKHAPQICCLNCDTCPEISHSRPLAVTRFCSQYNLVEQPTAGTVS